MGIYINPGNAGFRKIGSVSGVFFYIVFLNEYSSILSFTKITLLLRYFMAK